MGRKGEEKKNKRIREFDKRRDEEKETRRKEHKVPVQLEKIGEEDCCLCSVVAMEILGLFCDHCYL